VSKKRNKKFATKSASNDGLDVQQPSENSDDSSLLADTLSQAGEQSHSFVEPVLAEGSLPVDTVHATLDSNEGSKRGKKNRKAKKANHDHDSAGNTEASDNVEALADAIRDIGDHDSHDVATLGADIDADSEMFDEIAEPAQARVLAADEDENLELVDAEPGEAIDEASELPAAAAAMDAAQLAQLIEALIFATDRPLTLQRIRQLTRVADVTRIEAALAKIAVDYADRGIVLSSVSGGYQFRTRSQFSAWVQQLIAGRPVRLSRAQLETLAIIAYRQPITRPEIDDIRGVDSGGTLKVLLDRQLIRSLGKKEEVGRPVLYGTTKEFLDFFSLGDLRELPTLREYSELTDESRSVMKKMGLDADDVIPQSTVATDPLAVVQEQSEFAAADVPAADDDVRADANDEMLADVGSDDNDQLPSWVVPLDIDNEVPGHHMHGDELSQDEQPASEVTADGEWVAGATATELVEATDDVIDSYDDELS
jgi:segregation and condensation protein B